MKTEYNCDGFDKRNELFSGKAIKSKDSSMMPFQGYSFDVTTGLSNAQEHEANVVRHSQDRQPTIMNLGTATDQSAPLVWRPTI